MLRPLALLFLSTLLTACASSGQRDLADGAAVHDDGDFVPFAGDPELISVEERQGREALVRLNWRLSRLGQGEGIWLRLMLQNTSDQERTFEPRLELVDAAGRRIRRLDRDAVLLALTGKRGGRFDPRAYTGVAGTVASMAGFGRTAMGLGLLGQIGGAASSSGGTGQTARAEWTMAHWMPTSVTLKPGQSAAGVFVYPAPAALPLSLTVTLGDEIHRFVSRPR